MYKKSADATRSRVEVFIRTPYSEIDIPFVQGHGYISDRMSKVPATYTSLETFSSILRCKQRSIIGHKISRVEVRGVRKNNERCS